MKMLRYLLPLLLVSLTCTSAFSLSSLFSSADNAEEVQAADGENRRGFAEETEVDDAEEETEEEEEEEEDEEEEEEDEEEEEEAEALEVD